MRIEEIEKTCKVISDLKPCESIWVWADNRNENLRAAFKIICNGSGQLYFCDLGKVYTKDIWFEFWEPIQVIEKPEFRNEECRIYRT